MTRRQPRRTCKTSASATSCSPRARRSSRSTPASRRCTRWQRRCTAPSETASRWSSTCPTSCNGRRPIPSPSISAGSPHRYRELDDGTLDLAVGLLASARRPIVLAGRGAIGEEARTAALVLAERIGAPLATTLKARDLFRGEPHDLGLFGVTAGPATFEAIAAADCIVSLGARLNFLTTDKGALLEGKSLVYCDTDPSRIGLPSNREVGVLGDAAAVAGALVSWLDRAEIEPTSFREQLTIDSPAPTAVPERPTDGPVHIRTALQWLDRTIAADRCLVVDGGRFIVETYRNLPVSHPRWYVHTMNFGSIGLGTAAAVGASFGAPGRPVLLVCGDGGFMLGGLADFNAAVRHGVDLVVAVLDDGAYGAEHVQLRRRDMDPRLSVFEWPDFATLAGALGGQGVTVRSAGDLPAAAEAVANRDRPLLIDFKLDPDDVPSLR
ncbi:MAG: thiamine pyrophosphate-dependent enzyme [Ilumatobacteraceae bacterium]